MFIKTIEKESDLITYEVVASSVEGRDIYSVYFSDGVFGEDTSKIKVLIFAQQHGNEHSGKEGALLLIANLIKLENRYLFDKIGCCSCPASQS
ncbi:MAG: M14 family zinc carboxypeptidase [Melioribacteraceae bacterium]|nr:M14 family zinc carboxypeptidase [Melioribacteraceae bacterium]